ncbi:M28 family peptidase [Sphingomonas sp.]|uniref:M28 family peptidase n=1 Tax=Sphingomonas sp. TaxID=28214 RepID=UPI003BAD66A0
MLLRSLALAAALLFPAAALPDQLFEDVRILAADDMAGRLVGTPGSAKARAYLIGRMQGIGIEPFGEGYAQPFTAKHKEQVLNGVNLVGRIRGTGTSDRVLVVGAHYDHFGSRDGKVLNGADDNASGVAALLAIAADFARNRPTHDVIFALWDAEEQGLYGAHAFVDSPPVPRTRIALNLNLDMLSRSDKGELWVAGAHHYPFLRARFERLAKEAPVTLKIGHDGPPWTGSDDWTAGSDHYAFHRKGIPFAYLGVEDYPDYHQPSDDFDTIPKAFFARSAATAVMAARLFERELGEIAAEAGRGK